MRYEVVEDSGHPCCHNAMVVDTGRAKPSYADHHPTVCECHDVETAQMIADALNRTAPS